MNRTETKKWTRMWRKMTGLRISIEVTDVDFQEEVGINVDLNLLYYLHLHYIEFSLK